MTEAALMLKAVGFAAFKHRDQRRKDKEASPYINHPIRIAELLVTVYRERGHPLKGPCQEERRFPSKKKYFLESFKTESASSLPLPKFLLGRCQPCVENFTAPVTHQDQGHRGFPSSVDRIPIAELKVFHFRKAQQTRSHRTLSA